MAPDVDVSLPLLPPSSNATLAQKQRLGSLSALLERLPTMVAQPSRPVRPERTVDTTSTKLPLLAKVHVFPSL